MVLMIEKGISGGICHAIHRDAKANNKYIKIMIKTLSATPLNHHSLCIQIQTICNDGQRPKS